MGSTKCMNRNKTQERANLLDLHNGDIVAAQAAWEEMYETPAAVAAMENEDIVNNPSTMVEDMNSGDLVVLDRLAMVSSAKSILIAKLKGLTRIDNPNKDTLAYKQEIEDMLNKIGEVSAEESLVSFVDAALRMANTAERWADEISNGSKEPTMEHLKRMKEFIDTFALLQSMDKELFSEDTQVIVMDKIKQAASLHNHVRSVYNRTSRKVIADSVKGNFNKINDMYAQRFGQIWDKHIKAKTPKEERAAAKAEYIANQLAANATDIELQTTMYIDNLLMQSVDIAALNTYVVNPKDMNNDIIGIALRSMDVVDTEIRLTMIDVVVETERLNEEFEAYVGKSGSVKEKYGIFIEEGTGEGDNHLRLISSNSRNYKAFKAKYENIPAVWNLYEHMVKLAKEKDAFVYKEGRLGHRLPAMEQSTLERLSDGGFITMVKEEIDDFRKLRGKDVELGTVSEEQIKNDRLANNSDTESITLDQSGHERNSVPLHYRSMQVKPSDQSHDILRLLTLDYHNSLKFKAKTENALFLDILKDVVHEAKVIKTSAFRHKAKTIKGTGEAHINEGEEKLYSVTGDSNISKLLEGLIRHRLYGITTEGDPKMAKIMQSLGSYTAFLTMSVNAMSGAANFVQGATVSWIEALGNKTGFYTVADKVKAIAEYDKNIIGLMSDMGERTPKNKINLLNRHFNTFNETVIMNGKSYAQNNKLKRIGEAGALMGLNEMGEHAVQSVVMLSVLNNIKVRDINGNYMDSDFNPTKDRKLAIGVNDAMMEEDGKLVFHPSVRSTERTKGIGVADISAITEMVGRINRDLYGNYASDNKALIQRHATGALVSQMRGWLVTGFQKRYRGIGTSGVLTKDFKKLSERFNIDITTPLGMAQAQLLSYNTQTGEFEEGQYVTTIAFLRTIKMEMKGMQIMAGTKEAWNSMNDSQKANVRKTIIEVGVIIGALMIAGLFDDDKEDPNDIENIYVAYMSRRLYSELFSFANPNETMRTFQSPAIAISSIQNSLDVMIQMFDPTEVYKGGRHTGDSKLARKLRKMIPVLKQYDRSVEESYSFLKEGY